MQIHENAKQELVLFVEPNGNLRLKIRPTIREYLHRWGCELEMGVQGDYAHDFAEIPRYLDDVSDSPDLIILLGDDPTISEAFGMVVRSAHHCRPQPTFILLNTSHEAQRLFRQNAPDLTRMDTILFEMNDRLTWQIQRELRIRSH